MGAVKRRERYLKEQVAAYERSVAGIACPAGCITGTLAIVDLFTALPPFHEPGMPAGPRFLCAECKTEFDIAQLA